MPIYEFECEECGHVHEKLIFTQQEKLKKPQCPKCKGKVKQIMSKNSFRLIGDGWFNQTKKEEV